MVTVKTSKGWQIKLESGRLLPKIYGSKEEANRRIEQMETHKTESDIRYTVPIQECEVIEKDENNKPTKVRIGGTCLKPTISRNNNEYTVKNIQENDGKEVKFFIQEHGELEVKNTVGKMKLSERDNKLRYDGTIRNTKTHPDIVEHAINKEIEVSIDARASGRRVKVEEGKKIKSHYSVDVRALCGVGIGGLAENSMDYAIAESFKELEKNNPEVDNMSEKITEAELRQELAEKELKIKEQEQEIKDKTDEVKKAEDAAKKVEDEKKAEEKEILVKDILKTNKKLVEKELMEKEIPELKIISEYEKKLGEQEGTPAGEGEGEVKNDPEGEPTESDKIGILIEKEKDTIGMNPGLYKQFQDEIKKNL